ncbi:MAG: thiolase family protein [Planctomycetota bacterium]|nr:thiolase family protein [Planctomycetota bacterium]
MGPSSPATEAPSRRVAIVAGIRTPFIKAGKDLQKLGPLALARHCVLGLIERHEIDPGSIQALVYGVTVREPGRPNLAREIVLEGDLPKSIEAQTIASYCITGLRTVTSVAEAIATGRIDMGIAGGVESLSRADPNTFRESTTGLSMGEHTEITRREWNISRERQDELALASHRNSISARAKLSAEIYPVNGVMQDSGPRPDTSLEALSALEPVFDPEGTITAGNASPVTDGASAVLLMSEDRARREGREPLAFIRAMEYGAIDPGDGLLMAPSVVVPRLLKRSGLRLEQMDLVEIHEAFAAQVLANASAWEEGWKGDPTGPLDWTRVNVSGSSIALGHPWAATGGQILTSLANEMKRRGAGLGLVSVCAAGGLAGAMILERT